MATKLKNFSTTPASNNSAAPNGAPEGMAPSDVNNVIRENMARLAEWYQDPAWINRDTPTYIGATQFSVTGDQTAEYVQGRRVKATLSGSTIYGTIQSSAYTSLTTVTVNWDGAGALDATVTDVELSALTPSHQAEASDNLAYNTQTIAYTLTSSDNGKIVEFNSGSDVDCTLPENATEALPEGFHCVVRQLGVGQVSFVTEGSDTLNAPSGSNLRGQYSSAFIDLRTAGTPNTYYLIGDTA